MKIVYLFSAILLLLFITQCDKDITEVLPVKENPNVEIKTRTNDCGCDQYVTYSNGLPHILI